MNSHYNAFRCIASSDRRDVHILYIHACLAPTHNCVVPQEDVVLGRKLATGGFGTVYKGTLKASGGKQLPIIIKKVITL